MKNKIFCSCIVCLGFLECVGMENSSEREDKTINSEIINSPLDEKLNKNENFNSNDSIKKTECSTGNKKDEVGNLNKEEFSSKEGNVSSGANDFLNKKYLLPSSNAVDAYNYIIVTPSKPIEHSERITWAPKGEILHCPGDRIVLPVFDLKKKIKIWGGSGGETNKLFSLISDSESNSEDETFLTAQSNKK